MTAVTKEKTREFRSVHDAHCCKIHGCKYGHEKEMLEHSSFSFELCPVVYGDEQGVQCEICFDEKNDPERIYVKRLEQIVIQLKEQLVELQRQNQYLHEELTHWRRKSNDYIYL